MKDSAPGPDGISYSFYKIYWDIFGQVLADAWAYSIKENILPQSHKESFLTLIPKSGKDLSILSNWRPISLSLTVIIKLLRRPTQIDWQG